MKSADTRHSWPGRRVPALGEIGLDAAAENVLRRIKANGRNLCTVFLDADGGIRVVVTYHERSYLIPRANVVGTFNHKTPATAIRMALAAKIEERAAIADSSA